MWTGDVRLSRIMIFIAIPKRSITCLQNDVINLVSCILVYLVTEIELARISLFRHICMT
jgi:hypothetical protein